MAGNLDAFRNPAEATTDAEFEVLWTDLMEEPDRPRALLTLQEHRIAGPSTADTPPPPAERVGKKPARFRVAAPRIGTTLERSTAANARKLQGLLEVPPRPSQRQKPTTRPTKPSTAGRKEVLRSLFGDITDLSDDEAPGAPSTSSPAVVRTEAVSSVTASMPETFGPVGPPPVRVSVGGLEIEVPYFSATVTRKFRACIGQRKFVLRFNRHGECTFRREI